MNYTTELVLPEVQSSEEMEGTRGTRRGISGLVVPEDETQRINTVEEHNRKERIRWDTFEQN